LNRLVGLLLLAGIITGAMYGPSLGLELPDAPAKLVLALLLLLPYLMSDVFAAIKLPRITGYILAGTILGPHVFGFVTSEQIADLSMIEDLALAVIALAAGAELGFADLAGQWKAIGLSLAFQTILVPLMSGITAFLGLAYLGLDSGAVLAGSLAAAGLALARSPSSAIGIISETRARGSFTDQVMAVTISSDVLALFIFAAMISITASMVSGPDQGGGNAVLVTTSAEILLSMIAGALVGAALIRYLSRAKTGLVIPLLGVSFAVSRFARLATPWLETGTGLSLHMEPMLICLVAGLVVRNKSEHGVRLSRALKDGSLPIYALFFSMAGAAIDVEALASMWLLAMVIFAARALSLWLASLAASLAAGQGSKIGNAFGLSYLAQAGVSIGLCRMLSSRFPGWGEQVATLLIATIALNQVVGPVALKFALDRVKETAGARMKSTRR